MVTKTKHSVSAARQRLIELMQTVQFGRIYGLDVCNGDPVVDPLPRIVAEIKLDQGDKPPFETASDNFALKSQLLQMFDQFERIGNGTIDCVHVKNGLPFLMHVAHTA